MSIYDSTFDNLYKKMVKEEPWITYGLKCELLHYLNCSGEEIDSLFWMVKNGYSKQIIRDTIQKITEKTIEELDAEVAETKVK
jgi:hypothetical protein